MAGSSFTAAALAVAVWLTAAAPAAAVTLPLEPAADNVMSQDNEGYASGVGAYLFVGATASGARRSLLRFDLSAIPAGSFVQSVTFRFTVDTSARNSGNTALTLQRVTADWGEGTSNGGTGGGLVPASPGDATWLSRLHGSPPAIPRVSWQQPGGDFFGGMTAALPLPGNGTFVIPSSPALVADVQSWVDSPAGNFGWILRGEEAESYTARRLLSRHAGDSGSRPLLTVVYTPPDHGGGPPGGGGGGGPHARVPLPPAALALLAFVLAGLGAIAQRHQRPARRS